MVGRVDVDGARLERFRRLFLAVGVEPSEEVVRLTATAYRQGST